MKAAFMGRRCGGIALFFLLVAYAMAQAAAIFVVLPLLFLAVMARFSPTPYRAPAYLAVARTVCKNE